MSNSIQCTECCEWVHRRCSDAKVPMIKVQGFSCRICLTGRDNKDRIKNLVLENGEVIEGVLNGEGGSSMASWSEKWLEEIQVTVRCVDQQECSIESER